jgi:prepilin-type N-terminal cleavage/methylation domain-containing protein
MRNSHNADKTGFTLIELLIVVAIIAILAAIAVPNFLEAQTRAKVLRVKNDMRTLATGMEAYAVDWSKYPIPSNSFGGRIDDVLAATGVSPFETRVPVLLTTPVAFLSSRPEDVFATTRHGESRVYHAITTDYIETRATYAPLHHWRLIWFRYFRQLNGGDPPPSIKYAFVSFGPDMKHDADVPHLAAPGVPHEHNRGTIYDPTNGSISSGDILYFGPSIGFP